MAFSDEKTWAEHWSETRTGWVGISPSRRFVFFFLIVAGVTMIASAIGLIPGRIDRLVKLGWAAGWLGLSAVMIKSILAKRRAARNTLEGTE